jgi:hypothetical protein
MKSPFNQNVKLIPANPLPGKVGLIQFVRMPVSKVSIGLLDYFEN